MATSSPDRSLPRYTCPREAAAIGSVDTSENTLSMDFPSSCCNSSMAVVSGNDGSRSCRLCRTSINSGGVTSGRVDNACPNFTNDGPRSISLCFNSRANWGFDASRFPAEYKSKALAMKDPKDPTTRALRPTTLSFLPSSAVLRSSGIYSSAYITSKRSGFWAIWDILRDICAASIFERGCLCTSGTNFRVYVFVGGRFSINSEVGTKSGF
mmetsp:Transcript_23591/g.57126  ORF Transcript_23591/g.57126 Transcript_23591/m.57126 type:complete len:211 (-) Transcript_23591:576-1208(-)